MTPTQYSAILKARSRALSEAAILSGFWSARIHLEAEDGKGKPLGEYLDELLSDDELLEKSSRRLMAFFEGMIDGGEADADD